jgi:methylthioribulose-1-phosphate dehydratase
MSEIQSSHNSEEEVEAVEFSKLAARLAELGRSFYGRGWVLGTSGNFSAVVSLKPLRLAVTTSGVDKGLLTADHIVQIDGSGKVLEGLGRPSDEARLHLTVVRVRGARAILHTHSVWATLLSETYADAGGLSIEGYEMLKGLAGVRTHEHREWMPIIENSQDMPALAQSLEETLKQYPDSHGFLLRRHGLYTWGRDLVEAKRHVEILEFLLEVIGRTHLASKPDARAVSL